MKMKVKRILIIAVIVLIFGAWGARFITLNKSAEKQTVKIYNEGEFVPYEKDFFVTERTENRDGYSINVVKSELLPIEDYLKTINVTYDDYVKKVEQSGSTPVQVVLNLHIVLKNEGNTKGNFDMVETRVEGPNFTLQVDDLLFSYTYPNLAGNEYFLLRENTEFSVDIPFRAAVDAENFTYKFISSKDLYLNITQYPVRKMIKLNTK